MPPPQEAGGGAGSAKNDATAHLCAAAYIDRTFRDQVIDEVYRRHDRAIAPNPGTDAAPILRHVLRARALDTLQQAILSVLLLLAVCAPVVDRGGLLVALAVWALIGLPVLAIDRGFAPPPERPEEAPSGARLLGRAVLITVAAVGGLLLVVTALRYLGLDYQAEQFIEGLFGQSEYEECVDYYDDYYGDGYGASYCGAEPPPTGPGAGSVVVWLLVFAAVTTVIGVVRRRSLVSIPTEPEPPAPATARAGFIAMAQRAPVVNYNAGRPPFVGSGDGIATWQFALTLEPADRGSGEPMTIDPKGLNDFIAERIRLLGSDSPRSSRLPNLVLDDHVYVSGRDADRPVYYPNELPQVGYPQFQTIEQVQRDPTTPVRHYLRCEVDAWGGELVTTVFFHCALQGETLYVEFSSCVLPPTRERYHVFGRGSVAPGVGVFLGFLRGLALMPLLLVRSPFDLAAAVGRGFGRRSGRWGEPEDHGARVSIRELGTDLKEQNYFQFRDAVKYLEIMERQILDALVRYLHEHNVHTGELEERANVIVNNGVVNYGRLATGAAGAGATANVGAVGSGSRGSVKKGKS
jgi:hypothetical protein